MPLPRLARRLIMPLAMMLVTLVVFTSTPLLLLGAAAASPFLPGRLRPLRVLLFALVYLALETLLVVVLGLLWLAAGFGRRIDSPLMRRTHYRLAAWFLRALMATARHAFNLRVKVEGSPPHRGARVPLIVLARHAGPGDSFLLIHELLNVQGRRPRIVLKDALQWDPCIDIALGRLPTRFIPANAGAGSGVVDSIADLAAGMDPEDALVIFPEGANFSEPRRLRSIAKLEELGRHAEAERARAMRHLLAPRSGGMLAALAGCPKADVVLVAHTGLEDLSTVVDLWRGLPIDDEVRVRMWHVPATQVPRDATEQVEFLHDWWQRIDAWIADERGGPATAPAAPVSGSSFDDGRRDREAQRIGRSPRRDLTRPVLALIVAAVLVWFGLANSQGVTVDYLVTTRDSRLIIVIVTSALLGAVISRLLRRRRD